jgi:hypothetical protein
MHEPSGWQQTWGCGQLLGTQVLPGAGVVPGGQAEPTNVKQAFRSQQALRHGFGVQVVLLGRTKPLHCVVEVTSVHVPSEKQQTKPGGQVLGLHVLPGAGVEPVGHGPPVVKHEPSARQQARAQGFGLQVAPPVNDRFGGTGHCDHGAMKHVPDWVQQRPMHGLGWQVVPPGANEPAGQAEPTTNVQLPVVSQQTV